MLSGSASPEDIFDDTYYILEPHAAYISAGDDDPAKYYLPPGVLEALTWAALNVALPVLVGLATNVLSDILKRKKEQDTKVIILRLSSDDISDLKRGFNEAVASLDSAPDGVGPESKKAANDAVKKLLIDNGFPELEAASSSDQIVENLSNHLSRGK